MGYEIEYLFALIRLLFNKKYKKVKIRRTIKMVEYYDRYGHIGTRMIVLKNKKGKHE